MIPKLPFEIRLPYYDVHDSQTKRTYLLVPSESILTFKEFSDKYINYFSKPWDESLVFDSVSPFLEHLEFLKGKDCHHRSLHNSCIDGQRTLSLHYDIDDLKFIQRRVALYGYRRHDFRRN